MLSEFDFDERDKELGMELFENKWVGKILRFGDILFAPIDRHEIMLNIKMKYGVCTCIKEGRCFHQFALLLGYNAINLTENEVPDQLHLLEKYDKQTLISIIRDILSNNYENIKNFARTLCGKQDQIDYKIHPIISKIISKIEYEVQEFIILNQSSKIHEISEKEASIINRIRSLDHELLIELCYYKIEENDPLLNLLRNFNDKLTKEHHLFSTKEKFLEKSIAYLKNKSKLFFESDDEISDDLLEVEDEVPLEKFEII